MSLTERIDTITAAGKIVVRTLAVPAEFERDLVSERTAAALAHKRSLGQRVGDIPYGWRLVDDGVTLVPIESEQATIRAIRAMRDEGQSYRAIAEELTRRGIPTKNGRATWTHQAVASILKRPRGILTGTAGAGTDEPRTSTAMGRRLRTIRALKWVGTVSCILIAAVWGASCFGIVTYSGAEWFCTMEGGEIMYCPYNPDSSAGWGAVRMLPYYRRFSLPHTVQIGFGSPGPAQHWVTAYVMPLWVPLLVGAMPTIVLWLLHGRERLSSGLPNLIVRGRDAIPFGVWITLSASMLGLAFSQGLTDFDTLVAWWFAVTASALGCLAARRKQALTMIAAALIAAVLYGGGIEIWDWKPGALRDRNPWEYAYAEAVRTARLTAAALIMASCVVGYGLTVAIRSWTARVLARQGRCVSCGYNLTGNVSGRCPECGTPVKREGQTA